MGKKKVVLLHDFNYNPMNISKNEFLLEVGGLKPSAFPLISLHQPQFCREFFQIP